MNIVITLYSHLPNDHFSISCSLPLVPSSRLQSPVSPLPDFGFWILFPAFRTFTKNGLTMLSSISKSFRWEMGHRLPYHTQGCQNIHGHSYEMVVELFGETNEQGMLIDYNDLKAAVKPILDKWDHAFLVDEKDELLKKFLKENKLKYVLFKKYSTAEHIAHYFCAVLKNMLSVHKNLTKIKVVIRETVTSEATVELELNK